MNNGLEVGAPSSLWPGGFSRPNGNGGVTIGALDDRVSGIQTAQIIADNDPVNVAKRRIDIQAANKLIAAQCGSRDEGEAYEQVLSLQARRPFGSIWGLPTPSLPCSCLATAAAILSKQPRQVYLDADIDGLAIALSTGLWGTANATAVMLNQDLGIENHSAKGLQVHRQWFEHEAAAAACHDGVRFLDATNAGQCLAEVGFAVVGSGVGVDAALARAQRALATGAPLLLCVRHPDDGELQRAVRGAGWVVTQVIRDIGHWYVPSVPAVDGGADLVWLEHQNKGEEKSLGGQMKPVSKRLYGTPYHCVEFDALGADVVGTPQDSLGWLADCCRALGDKGESLRFIDDAPERSRLWWADDLGAGFLAELHAEHRHLLITLMPYSPLYERLIVELVLQGLAGVDTRTRPLRTQWSGDDAVFAWAG